ncbi:MAG: right-handed parallel beta-helix repeat-containing protein [Capsulimonadaceae bacterium]|nr:right-handed parallel beta-helix repeat-containing protein [Capsulimonadaceae bacterium]
MRSTITTCVLASTALFLAFSLPGSAAVLDITKPPYNAVGDGATDNTAAINKALHDAATATPKDDVIVPPGKFAHSGQINVDGVRFGGADAGMSILVATNPQSCSINLRGDGPALDNLELDCPTANKRLNCGWQTGVQVTASHYRVHGIRIGNATTPGSPSAGIICLGASFGAITGNTIFWSLADAIHMTSGSHDIVVKGNTILKAGDDMIAVVSYLNNATPCRNIIIQNNDCLGQTGGRGITVIGGDHVVIDHNRIENSSSAGIHLASESSYRTFGPANVTITNNTLKNCDTYEKDCHGSIFVYGNDLVYNGVKTHFPAKNIIIRGNTILDAHNNGIRLGDSTENVTIDHNVINGSEREGIAINIWAPRDDPNGPLNTIITGNDIANTASDGIFIGPGGRGSLIINDNALRDIGKRVPGSDAIAIDSANKGVTSLTISGNKYQNPSGYASRGFINCPLSATAAGTSADKIRSSNFTDTGKPIAAAP